jgi:glycine/D-amino acid oxidase-like deaminating enzyme
MKSELPILPEGLTPLWEATAGPWDGFAPLTADGRCDVAIVGGGFTGLSAALALAQGGARAMLVEADSIGCRASGRNGGQVVPGLKPRADHVLAAFGAERGQRMLDFAHAASGLTFDLIARLGIDCDPTRNGWIQGAFSPRAREDLRQRAAINARHGGDVEFLDERRVAALTGSDFHHGGMIERAAGAVHPLKFGRGLARAVAAAGGSLHERTRATAVERSGTRWAVATDGGTIVADRVILATDAYTGRLWPRLAQSLVNVTSAQLATAPLAPALLAQILPARAGVSETRKITYYYRIDPEGRFVIGGRGPSDDGLDRATILRIARAARERFPQLGGTPWAFGWACRVAITLDDMPHVHALAPGVWTAAGYCGRGVALAVSLGAMLGALALGAREDEAAYPLTPLRRMPFYPLRQPGAAAAIIYYRMKDRLGLPT